MVTTVMMSSITSFHSLNNPVALFINYFNVMDDWQDKIIGFIPHLPSINIQIVETYDELMT